MNLFLKVYDNILYVMYFTKFYNNFYFFLNKHLFYFDNDLIEITTKAKDLSYYMIYNEF